MYNCLTHTTHTPSQSTETMGRLLQTQGYSVASFRSGHSRRRPSVTNLGKRLMNTFSKPPREYSTMSGSIGSSVGGSSIGSSSIGDSLGGGMVGGSYRGQAAQYPTPGARKVSIRRNSYIT